MKRTKQSLSLRDEVLFHFILSAEGLKPTVTISSLSFPVIDEPKEEKRSDQAKENKGTLDRILLFSLLAINRKGKTDGLLKRNEQIIVDPKERNRDGSTFARFLL